MKYTCNCRFPKTTIIVIFWCTGWSLPDRYYYSGLVYLNSTVEFRVRSGGSDLQMGGGGGGGAAPPRGGGGGGGGGHPDPEIRKGPGLQKNFLRPFEPHFGRKIRGEPGFPGPSPGSATGTRWELAQEPTVAFFFSVMTEESPSSLLLPSSSSSFRTQKSQVLN